MPIIWWSGRSKPHHFQVQLLCRWPHSQALLRLPPVFLLIITKTILVQTSQNHKGCHYWPTLTLSMWDSWLPAYKRYSSERICQSCPHISVASVVRPSMIRPSLRGRHKYRFLQCLLISCFPITLSLRQATSRSSPNQKHSIPLPYVYVHAAPHQLPSSRITAWVTTCVSISKSVHPSFTRISAFNRAVTCLLHLRSASDHNFFLPIFYIL